MTAFIDVLIDGDGPSDGTFVEVEDDTGKSICAGVWLKPINDRFWRLRIKPEVFGKVSQDLRKGEPERPAQDAPIRDVKHFPPQSVDVDPPQFRTHEEVRDSETLDDGA